MADSDLEEDVHAVDKRERHRQSVTATAWASLSLVTGAVLLWASMAGSKSEAIYLMDKVVRFDTAGPFGEDLAGASHVLTTLMLVRILLFVGLAVVVTSLIGITASTGKHKCLAATYGSCSLACAGVMLVLAMQVMQRIYVVEPLVHRQVEHLCNESIYLQLGHALDCSWASRIGAGVEECGAACRWKISLLQGVQGCRLMPQLCESFFYEELASQNCSALIRTAASGIEPLFVASQSSSACRDSCDADIKCKEFSHSEATAARPEVCMLYSGLAALHQPPAWSQLAPVQVQSYLGEGKTECWRRTDPTVLSRFQSQNTRIAVCTVVLAVVLLVTVSASFTLMYNLNHRRSRLTKPNGSQLWMMMFCPCCVGHLYRRFHRLPLSDDSSSESE